jgi:hypothetical protein
MIYIKATHTEGTLAKAIYLVQRGFILVNGALKWTGIV